MMDSNSQAPLSAQKEVVFRDDSLHTCLQSLKREVEGRSKGS
jgi:hypothetical protein